MSSMKRTKDNDTEGWTHQVDSAQHATGEEWRNSSRKTQEAEPKQKQPSVVDVTGDGSKSPML